jgi:hypothetical protein
MFWYGQDGQRDGGGGSRRDAVLVICRYANRLHTEKKEKEYVYPALLLNCQYSEFQMYVQDSQGGLWKCSVLNGSDDVMPLRLIKWSGLCPSSERNAEISEATPVSISSVSRLLTFSPEARNGCGFQNVVSCPEYQTIDTVQNSTFLSGID